MDPERLQSALRRAFGLTESSRFTRSRTQTAGCRVPLRNTSWRRAAGNPRATRQALHLGLGSGDPACERSGHPLLE